MIELKELTMYNKFTTTLRALNLPGKAAKLKSTIARQKLISGLTIAALLLGSPIIYVIVKDIKTKATQDALVEKAVKEALDAAEQANKK